MLDLLDMTAGPISRTTLDTLRDHRHNVDAVIVTFKAQDVGVIQRGMVDINVS